MDQYDSKKLTSPSVDSARVFFALSPSWMRRVSSITQGKSNDSVSPFWITSPDFSTALIIVTLDQSLTEDTQVAAKFSCRVPFTASVL